MPPTPLMDFGEWYAERALDLSWLARPQWHEFRWRGASGAWRRAPRTVRDGAVLARLLARDPPRDLYVGTASWLDPVDLPRLRDASRPPPILLDHLVVFDVDESPFSIERLDCARESTRRLVEWMERETRLDVVHVTFSGGKGFHVVARDPDRAPFREPEPRRREAAVRAQRRALLERALAAGHPVDRTVTADTRRIVRLPGSLHGTTGWACRVIPREWLESPVASWLPRVPRHASAEWPPDRAPAPVPTARRTARPEPADRHAPTRALELQATTHVAGTRDRSALLAWLPRAWGADEDAVRRADALARRAGVGPAALWSDGERLLALAPRAVPRSALARAAVDAGLARLAGALDARGHAWVAVAPRHAVGEAEPASFTPIGVVAAGAGSEHPWSRPHLDLARRLGIGMEPPLEAEVAGAARTPIRLAEIR